MIASLVGLAIVLAGPSVQVESFDNPSLYAISDDKCVIVEAAHRAICSNAGGYVVYSMHAGDDPLLWRETATCWTESMQSHDLQRRWVELHCS